MTRKLGDENKGGEDGAARILKYTAARLSFE